MHSSGMHNARFNGHLYGVSAWWGMCVSRGCLPWECLCPVEVSAQGVCMCPGGVCLGCVCVCPWGSLPRERVCVQGVSTQGMYILWTQRQTPPRPRGRHPLPHCMLGYTPPAHCMSVHPLMDRQTPVKILPCPKLRLWPVIILCIVIIKDLS